MNLSITIKPHYAGFIAECRELSLCGNGETRAEALKELFGEFETLFADLAEDDEFSEDWLDIKRKLFEKAP